MRVIDAVLLELAETLGDFASGAVGHGLRRSGESRKHALAKRRQAELHYSLSLETGLRFSVRLPHRPGSDRHSHGRTTDARVYQDQIEALRWRGIVMAKKLQLHDAVGPFETKSNLDNLYDAHAATQRLESEADGFWKAGSKEHCRWIRACRDFQDALDTVRTRQKNGERVENVLADVINEFCHSEYRMVELLSSREREKDIKPTLEWLHVVFRAAIYGTVRTWLPRGQADPPSMKLTISLSSGQATEEYTDHTPWQILHKYKGYK